MAWLGVSGDVPLFRISYFVFRISHFAFRISHLDTWLYQDAAPEDPAGEVKP
jgi:hypothetical protein